MTTEELMWKLVEDVLDYPYSKATQIKASRRILAGTGWLHEFDSTVQAYAADLHIDSVRDYYAALEN